MLRTTRRNRPDKLQEEITVSRTSFWETNRARQRAVDLRQADGSEFGNHLGIVVAAGRIELPTLGL